ncbi:dihydroorotase [Clostridium sp. CM028]|uniref:dihydroorotase n=1 Tax=Clostridium sp. CM028 TaxID=2851575 RepID=UPI001C6E989C|nr:dihydroorotase [Clostridium sp. CM028]MBW9147877.1 dihydroorotase [Clostridium sp. CM028]WLC61314.1 dihydroorotase [Clostridium sp. CM028]
MELLIKNARVVDSSQDFIGDVYINKGTIYEIGKKLEKDCEVINGEGYILAPSFIDLHSHFREPGYTYKEDILSGSQAAVRGGYTAVNLMANTKPVCSSMDTIDKVLKKSREINLLDIHQCASITEDLLGKSIDHLGQLTNAVRFISDDGKGVYDSRIMLEAMVKAKEKDLTVISHAENEELVEVDTRLAENMMTWRDIALSKFTGCKLHLAHVSTKEAMLDIIKGKQQGGRITCEVTPHHLALTEETNYRVNPPMRKVEDVSFLIQAIKDGFVDVIATDHAPHSVEDKIKGAPGISGLESSFPVCYTKLVGEGHITLNKLSELMSKNPAKIMGFNKGEIKIGYDGDLVLLDTKSKYNIDPSQFLSKGHNSPFEGKAVVGRVMCTIKAGRIIYKDK